MMSILRMCLQCLKNKSLKLGSALSLLLLTNEMQLSLTHVALLLGASQNKLFQSGSLPTPHHLKDNLFRSVITSKPPPLLHHCPSIISSL